MIIRWPSRMFTSGWDSLKIGSKVSDLRTINISVSQGSILSPILFLYYVNDLPNACPNLSTLMNADDTTLTATQINYHSLIKLLISGRIISNIERF